ncbi:MAG: tape measure protein [Desulfuromusa sp.]|nr:tape measure protein [Desulfuromusa sp.]
MNDLKVKLVLDAVDKASPELKKVDGQVDRLDTTVGKAGKAMKVFGGIMAGLALGKLAADFMSVNVEFDRLHASLVTVTGSTAAADVEFEKIKEFAKTTPYQLAEVTDAFIKMKALGLDASERSMRSYGNTASAMGKSLNQMIEAVADASTGEFERLKEFGIKARQNGDRVKLTFRGVTTEIKNSAKSIEAYLLNIGEVDFAGGMDRQMDTLGGKLSNFEDAWDGFVRKIGEAGTKDTVVWAIQQATEALTDMGEAIDALADRESSFHKTVKWLNTGSNQIVDFIRQGIGGGNRGEYTPEELASMDLAGNYIPGSKIKIKGADAFRDRSNKRELDLALQQNTYREVEGESSKNTWTKKELEAYTKLGKDITDSWEQMYRDRNAIQSRSLDVQIQMEEEAAKLSSIPWEATKDFWQIQAEDKFEVLSRSTEALIALDNTWQTALMDGLDELADYYDETFSDRLTGTVFDAFSTMEDTIVDFVMTGKASFKDMVDSILADMVRLTIQQNISSPLVSALNAGLSGLFGGAVSEASNLFGGDIYRGATSGEMSSYFSKYHDGGKVVPKFHFGGLASDEVYAKLQTDETVIDRDHTRRMNLAIDALEQSGGGGEQIIQHIAVDARGSSVSAADIEQAVARGAERGYQKVHSDIVRRGPIRRAIN